MSTSPSSPESFDPAAAAREAAAWLARRDRGLSPAEQDDYMHWLQADPRHGAILARHAAAFERMMQLYEWQPGRSAEPNPDLFAPPRPRRRARWPVALAAAAALMVAGAIAWRAARPPAAVGAENSHLRVNERHALPDGSIVELKDGSHFTTEFAPAQRLVRLTGEAHFKVAKDAARPFIVE